MRRIFKLKTRKEDPRRYINVESEEVTSTYGELAGYINSAVRWVKKIIHTNDENSALPAWIACNRFYSKPQEINRVHKRKVP
jgi:alkylated DNA nucleotide flippase Atl1